MFGGEDEDLVWVTGDLHPENLGAYSDSRGVVVYNMNDFDDGTVEDYQMELLRMATGLILMSRANGFIEDLLYWIVSPFLDAYVGRMRDLNKLNGTYPEKDCDINAKTAKGLLKDFLKNVERNDGREEMLRKHVKKGKFDYDSNKFEKINDPAEEKDLRRAYADVYSETLQGGLKWDPEYFKIKDVARRVNSGTGSLGLSRYYVLIEGPTESDSDDRILDVKGEIIPTPVLFWQWDRRELYEIRYAGNHAMAYVEAARALQSNEDDHLGWLRTRKGTFVVRERSPFKETFDTRMLRGKEDYMEMSKQWGYIVANSHARGRGRWIASKDFVRHFWEKRLHKGEKWKDFTALIWDVAVDFNAQVMKDFSGFLQVFGPRMKDCPAPDRV
ncbi:hypothetical protein DFJ74DRAFT_44113 [Hyaloraphidium curvatum]|nr:hypothetical protein DFJ74DRAFT_44113 [Hyaloraphidium curvatum]